MSLMVCSGCNPNQLINKNDKEHLNSLGEDQVREGIHHPKQQLKVC